MSIDDNTVNTLPFIRKGQARFESGENFKGLRLKTKGIKVQNREGCKNQDIKDLLEG